MATPTTSRFLLLSLLLVAPAPASFGAGPSLDCLLQGILSPPASWPDYSAAGASLAPHCYGTNHQWIDSLDRVVFLGDSITVGTPPTSTGDLYRNRLADALVAEYGLAAPSSLWRAVDPFAGTSLIEESGDFASCALWGARAHDLLAGDEQIDDCFGASDFDQRTLVVMTIGGNDVAQLAEDAAGGALPAELEATRDAFVQQIRDALVWFWTPGRFPNGVFVVFANIYDPTDGSGLFPGLCAAVVDPLLPIADLVIGAQESMLESATERGFDLVFMHEHYCGHGLNSTDPAAPCYRGAGQELWIDQTCIHPTPEGHAALADDFFATITAEPLPVPGLPRSALGLLGVLLAVATARARSIAS